MSGADEFFELARDFGKAPAAVASGLYDAFLGAGEGFRDDWAHNVRAVAPAHLPHLPNAITTENRVAGPSIWNETGPESGRRQGALGRGDEFGSRNQPPHLNGLRAMPVAEKRLDRLADAAIAYSLP